MARRLWACFQLPSAIVSVTTLQSFAKPEVISEMIPGVVTYLLLNHLLTNQDGFSHASLTLPKSATCVSEIHYNSSSQSG